MDFVIKQLPCSVRDMSACSLHITHRIHVWYIYLHLVDFYGRCRQIYHTWILWVMYVVHQVFQSQKVPEWPRHVSLTRLTSWTLRRLVYYARTSWNETASYLLYYSTCKYHVELYKHVNRHCKILPKGSDPILKKYIFNQPLQIALLSYKWLYGCFQK